MTTPVKEYSLNVLATPETQMARPTVLVCVPVHHGPYDLVVRVRTGRYDSRDHRVRSRDLPSAVHDPPPASVWSDDGMTITMYPFKAWDGPVTEDPAVAAARHQAPSQSDADGGHPANIGARGDDENATSIGRTGGASNDREHTDKTEEGYACNLPSDDTDIVPGTPG